MTLSNRTVTILGLVAAFATGLAVAAVPATDYVAGQVLTATALQDDFLEVESRLTALETPQPAFCGITGGTFTGDLGGYGGAQTHCASVCGGSGPPDPGAHMCTSEEVLGHSVKGGSFASHPSGMWYAAGYHAQWGGVDGKRDCLGFTSASGSEIGAIFNTNGSYYPTSSGCADSRPIACCR